MTVVVDIFRVLATCTSLMMLLSPVPSIRHICRTKSTGVASIVPLVTMFTNSHIVMLFGYVSEQYFPVFSTFVAGDLISIVYITLYYRYTHERTKARKMFMIFAIPAVLTTVYAFLGGYGLTGQSRHDAGQVVGYLTIISSSLLYSSPMERIGHVLKHRSAVFLNIHMICAGTLNNLMWIIYSALVKQWVIFGPNAFCMLMGCIQITLYFAFHPSKNPIQAPPAHDMGSSSTTSESTRDDLDGDLELGVRTVASSGALKGGVECPGFVPLVSPLQAKSMRV